MQIILIHIKINTFVKYGLLPQSLQQTWCPIESTIVVTGSYWLINILLWILMMNDFYAVWLLM